MLPAAIISALFTFADKAFMRLLLQSDNDIPRLFIW